MQKRFTAAILAGGIGSRMEGVVKSNLLIGGETIMSRILAVLNDLFDEIIIVTNNPGEFVRYPCCRLAQDQYTGIGPLGGIHAALKAACCNAVFVLGGDLPLLSRKLIAKQIDLFIEWNCDILVPKTGTSVEPLHSLYRRSVLNQLEEYLSEKSNNAVREFFRTVDTRYMILNDSEEIRNIFSNVNIPSDVTLIEKIIRGGKK